MLAGAAVKGAGCWAGGRRGQEHTRGFRNFPWKTGIRISRITHKAGYTRTALCKHEEMKQIEEGIACVYTAVKAFSSHWL